jgi:hypothetical protein
MPPISKKEKEQKQEQAIQKVDDSLKLQQIALTTTVEDLLASGALPPGVDTKEKIMTISQYGKELGMNPMTAINSISLVKGRMVIGSAMLGAMLKRNGYEYLWNKDWVIEEGADGKNRTVTEVEIFWVSKSLKRELSQKFKMTWQELELTGLTSRDTYMKYPKALLRARCMSAAVRAIAPEILLGMYTAEELADSDPNIKLKVDEEGNVSVNAIDTNYEEIND